jgi:cytochrome P450
MFALQSYLTGLLVTVVTWYALYTWSRRRLYQMSAMIPGPNGVPFFGEALSVVGNDHTKAFRSLTSLAKNYDTPSRIWYGPYCAVILDHAKDLQIVLNSKDCIDKSEVYKFIGLDKGLVVAGGDLWRTHRKLLDPSFNINLLHSFIPIFNEKAKVLIDTLGKTVTEEEFDIYQNISACTLEALLESMTGLKNDIQSDAKNNEYLISMDHGTKLMNDRLFKVWYHIPFVFRFSSIYSDYQKYVENGVFAMSKNVLRQKSAKKADIPQTKHKIFIDQLLSAKHELTDDEIADEINTMIGAVS